MIRFKVDIERKDEFGQIFKGSSNAENLHESHFDDGANTELGFLAKQLKRSIIAAGFSKEQADSIISEID